MKAIFFKEHYFLETKIKISETDLKRGIFLGNNQNCTTKIIFCQIKFCSPKGLVRLPWKLGREMKKMKNKCYGF